RRWAWLSVAALVAGLGVVASPATASSATQTVASSAPQAAGTSVAAATSTVDVYTTPGRHSVNGREWLTTCGAYSSVIDRCRTEILASTVVKSGSSYRHVQAWVFNNLTYLPAPRAAWRGNPLAET